MVRVCCKISNFFVVFITIISSFSSYAILLENNTYYKIEHKAHGGVLALNSSDTNETSLAVLEKWQDLPRQKWISKQTDIIHADNASFPTPNRDEDTLDIDFNTCTLKVFPNASVDYTKYWRLRDMGDGVMEIKNYKTGSCIGSQGVNMPVVLFICDNSAPVQWTFVKLKDSVGETN